MKEFRFGPVEFYLVGFDGDRPDPSTFGALTDLVSTGVVRVLDFVLVTRTADGELEILEREEAEEPLTLDGLEPIVSGLASEDDVRALAEVVPPGRSAAVVVLELLFARTLAQAVAEAGGQVLRSERVPAPVVNAVMDILEQEGD
ncbi:MULTISPECIES: DUF6325 family protein [unclassified Microbacterium]|uniref:DUF6325 family protein n=1 Tax=unclassified Microbacterium TaxID=2609290 RepID=UPI0008F4B8F3|nr:MULTISPECIES: DUF6325 family protein [unclassified Microbacterium]OIJ33813.1 hypothetical protein BK819_05990 [Microbacterium sp. LCT-H2]